MTSTAFMGLLALFLVSALFGAVSARWYAGCLDAARCEMKRMHDECERRGAMPPDSCTLYRVYRRAEFCFLPVMALGLIVVMGATGAKPECAFIHIAGEAVGAWLYVKSEET